MSIGLVNGKEPRPELTPLEAAQKRLIDAAMAQGIAPNGLASSAYINGLLQSARVSAMAKLMKVAFPDLDVDELLTQLALHTLNEEIIPKLEAAKAPTILTSSGRH